MNICKRTIMIPVWYDGKKGIYVPTVDIPTGEWVLILTPTPVYRTPQDQVPDCRITIVREPVGVMLETLSEPFADRCWRFQFNNRLAQTSLVSPAKAVAIDYTIEIHPYPPTARGKNRVKPRQFDPIVVVQPDPIYP